MLPKRVKWAVSDFASFTSPGIDGIYPVVLQKGIDIIIERLVRLLQASIALGYIPTQWRTARVVFVPKPGHNDYTQPKSFRPISLMSFLLKTTERLIHRHIRDGPLVRYHLHANQHAYLAGKSTDIALHNLVSKIESAVHGKQYALGVFLAIEEAFNNASSGALLNVLRSKRVSNTVIDWIKSMLSTRIARGTSGDTIIEVRLHKGFLQNGVLSALMWILVADGLL